MPIPESWPDCGFPVVAKPSNSSGSRGVHVLYNEGDYKRKETEVGGFQGWILQELVQGKLFSVEVIGSPGNHHAVQITDLFLDEFYDCKRVLAPTMMSPELGAEFERMSVDIAGALRLKGLMDVEVILQDRDIRVLEVDARMPSQTPTAVYWSTGLNLVKELGSIFLSSSERSQFSLPSPRGVVYEHIRVSPDFLEVAGEHIMSGVDPLHAVADFFGVNEAITNYSPGRDEWVATLITSGTDREDAWDRREEAIRDIRRSFDLSIYQDRGPMP
jgi:pyrrolysine biosynthesis protein PylC